MRSILTLIAASSLLALVACSSSDPSNAVSPGVVGAAESTSESCPATCEQSASPGAVSDSGGCPYSGKSTTDASLGVVGDDSDKSGGCSSKSGASSANLGVVGNDDAKSGCGSSKSDTNATSLGVVGDAMDCPGSKPATGGDCTRSGHSL